MNDDHHHRRRGGHGGDRRYRGRSGSAWYRSLRKPRWQPLPPAYALCAITSASDALALLARLYPHQKPPLKTRLFLEELLGPTADRDRSEH